MVVQKQESYKFKAQKGHLFVIDKIFEEKLIKQNISYQNKSCLKEGHEFGYLEISWLKYKNTYIEKLYKKIVISNDTNSLSDKLNNYIELNKKDLSEEWINNARFLITS